MSIGNNENYLMSFIRKQMHMALRKPMHMELRKELELIINGGVIEKDDLTEDLKRLIEEGGFRKLKGKQNDN